MDFSSLPNPYDFANPITDSTLFVGRTQEMEEIRYYLNHATKAPRPINLAILGARASGKTSVLNMIELEAEKMDFLVVRIDLDEADAETQLAFFYKIFDSVLTTACLHGVYGGVTDRIYDNYRNIIDTFEIPDDKSFCPFIFPLQYSRAIGSGNTTAPLSETNFKYDLDKIRQEVKKQIILIFDEGDVLSKSRIHLEKLRNTFMNLPGFMLVTSGSQSLFLLIDEVFSPIIRQFKKIHLEPFKDQRDTKNGIRKPLESVGIVQRDVIDLETYLDIGEFHDLSGGRPYEIQLLCHVMFRRVQEGRAERMQLTLDVLDDVRTELENFQDVAARPLLTTIRNLDENGLSALSVLSQCSGYGSFDQIWFREFVYHDHERWTRDELLEQLHDFAKKNIIKIADDIISLGGDDFDRIYTKYLARKHQVMMSTTDMPYEISLMMGLHLFLLERYEDIEPLPIVTVGEIPDLGIPEVAIGLGKETEEDNPFNSEPTKSTAVYWSMIDFRESDVIQFIRLTVTSPWMTVQQWYRWFNPEAAKKHSMNDIVPLLEEAKERAKILDGNLEWEVYDLPIIPMEKLTSKVQTSQNIKKREDLADRHSLKMVNAYAEKESMEEALFHGELSYVYHPKTVLTNNFGYLMMTANNLTRARRLFEEAMQNAEKPEDTALANYNLGIVNAKEGQLEDAISKFELAAELIEKKEKKDRMMFCLVLPKNLEGNLIFEEVFQIDLSETSQLAVSAVREVLTAK